MRERLTLVASLLALPAALAAQHDRLRVHVNDTEGMPVPFATVQLQNGTIRIADDSARAFFNLPPADSIRLVVRRIGYAPFSGWVQKEDSDGTTFRAVIENAATVAIPVSIEARRNTPLANRGFYDRVDQVQRGAITARFYPPEELESRNLVSILTLVREVPFIRVQIIAGRHALTRRGEDCGVTIIVDGVRVAGTVESLFDRMSRERRALDKELETTPTERERVAVRERHARALATVEDLVSIQQVAAVEAYATAAQAPVAMQRHSGASQCPVLAIWTGSRR